MLHFLKDWWKFIQIHQNYTMALQINKAEIARESVQTTLYRASCALDPCQKWVRFRARNVRVGT